jgi:Arc/MetJ family transcription regulator
MRTTIDIDDALMKEARSLTAIKKKRTLVETALRDLIRHRKLAEIASTLGQPRLNLTQRDLRKMRGG